MIYPDEEKNDKNAGLPPFIQLFYRMLKRTPLRYLKKTLSVVATAYVNYMKQMNVLKKDVGLLRLKSQLRDYAIPRLIDTGIELNIGPAQARRLF
jgi:hypothetical protein